MERADQLFDLTPREIAWRFEALAARRRERDEEAWMTAKYVALAVHTPEKLPPRPVFYRKEQKAMTDDELRSRLLSWAGKGETS